MIKYAIPIFVICLLCSCSHSRKIIYHPSLAAAKSIESPGNLSGYRMTFDQLTEDRLDSLARVITDRNRDRLGFSSKDLRLRRCHIDKSGAVCEYDQLYSGIRVYASNYGISILRSGNISGGGNVYPISNVPTTPKISAEDAAAIMKREFHEAADIYYSSELVIVPEEASPAMIYHLARLISIPGRNLLVDAMDGSVLASELTFVE